jgi:hypothetical protein
MPPIGGAEAGQASQLGQLVRLNGRYAIYRLDLGNGNFIVTFIIRA